MHPVFQKIEADINHSFYVGYRKSHYFPNPFMFHPEIEILLVIKGTGTRLIGDSVDRFGPGDLVMIGQNVPHVWYNDEEYTKENTLEKVCSIASLSESAFCHYFKKRTNKTFIHFLTEIRIAFACRLLTAEDQPVEKICYACGYTNVSYFIRQFKGITGYTPLSYKKRYAD